MDKLDELLNRGVADILPSREGLAKLIESRKIRLYQGFDPTGPQLHIGHAVALRKLRQFQDLGHHVIFLIGDFTATIGDPTGKLSTRGVLTREQVLENAKTYKEQASKILRFEGENPAEIKFNNDWLGKMPALEFLKLSHLVSVQQVVERDMFQGRIKQKQDIYMNEFIYPLLQAYDSVVMEVDLEVGGTDQMFNMMMGRRLMKKMKSKEKFVLTVPLLTDSNGNKIGKTEGNVIGLTDEPSEFYGKIMALGDDSIINCFNLLTNTPEGEINEMKKSLDQGENPMKFKKKLAFVLTEQFNSTNEAHVAQDNFEKTFQNKKPEFNQTVPLSPDGTLASTMSEVVGSMSELKRLVAQGAVDVDGQAVSDPKLMLMGGEEVKVGKKEFYKVVKE